MSDITLRPDGTVSLSGWADQAGGTTNLHGPLADESRSTYVESVASPNGASFRVSMANPPAGVANNAVFLTLDVIQV
jgi:hypothetical protein